MSGLKTNCLGQKWTASVLKGHITYMVSHISLLRHLLIDWTQLDQVVSHKWSLDIRN